jgi:hypothetical protein
MFSPIGASLGGGRIIRALALLAVTSLVTGCSVVRLGYGQGPEFALWGLDSRLALTPEQHDYLREPLQQWFDWHRRTQLPDYAALLEAAQREVLQPASAEQVCRWADAVEQRAATALDQALPLLAGLALRLEPAQRQRLARRFERERSAWRSSHPATDRAAWQRALHERTLRRLENFYGRLDDGQRERLARWLADSPADPALWDAERRQRQQALLETLAPPPANGAVVEPAARLAQTQARLAQALQPWVRTDAPADAEVPAQRLRRFQCALYARVHNETTPAQRAHAAARLRGWEADARALANGARW